MDYIGGKHDRILAIYNNLLEGGRLNVKSAAEYYEVSTKTIRRDIDDIRNFFSEKCVADGINKEIVYDRANDNYYIKGNNKLTAKELIAISKVMLDSRAFCKEEFISIIDKMIDRCSYDKDATHIKDMIANEKYHYTEPQHRKKLIDTLWEISEAIKNQKKIKIVYERLTEPRYKERVVEPVGIMFSDFYFYLAAFIPEKNTTNPTIYRVDRISEYKVTDVKFKIPYASRFEEGEFRKRVQFMYGGDLLRLEFKYYGESPEAIIDRLPTAELVSQDNNCCTFKAEVFGRGIKPWLLGQADKIEVIKPVELRNEILDLVNKIQYLYNKR